ncbi:retrotransposon-related protein, partial [Trifolium pratense]
RITDLPHQFYLSCFISGLRADIRREVMAFQPASLTQAISLAKLQEEKLNDKSHVSTYRRPDTSTSTFRPPPRPTLTTTPTPPPNNPPPTTLPNRPTPIKRLSPAELQARRERGLCYNCDERYQPGHRCRRQFYILIAEPDSYDEQTETLTNQLLQPEPTPDTPTPHPDIDPQISLHALMGHTIPQTIRLVGQINNQTLSILVDSGSTHNFIQDRVAKQLGLTLEPTPSFQVLVDLFVLPLSGAEIVLGVQWLLTLGPTLTDYSHLSISFCREGKIIQLMGRPKPTPTETSLHQFKRLIATDAIDTHLYLQLFSIEPNTQTTQIHDPMTQTLLQKYQSLFQEPHSLPPSRNTDHHIPLTHNADPVNIRPYRYPQFQKHEIEQQIQQMLSQGIIQPSSSAFSSPVLLVRKKDGSWRFCVDYRALNAVTVKDRFPIPTIDELLDELYGTKWYSKLDLRSGYHQIRMASADIQKTAFRTHLGHYEFLVMPFGLCNAPSTFQNVMNTVFQQYLRQFVIVFFDDILVYSKTLEEHLYHLELVFNCLLENNFFLKESKCTFAQESISYLGHIVSAKGVGPDPEKIQAMSEWPTPTTIKQLRGFLGLTGFYRKFVKDYAIIASPLTDLLRKDAFNWSASAQIAFDALKKAMSEAPVLVLPNFDEEFTMETDASGTGMGAVLCQKGHPICYYSKKFCPKMQKASTYNRVADALSRVHENPSQCLTITIPHWDFIQQLRQSFLADASLQELMKQVRDSPSTHPEFQIIQDLLFYRGKLFIPTNSSIKTMLLEEFHSSPIGGHSGIHKTLGRLKENVYWENMREDVTKFVKACDICQQTKHPNHLPYGLLQPLPVPAGVWEDISLDFIIGLPSFQTHTVILVVVDRFSKAAHFGMLPTHHTASKVADLFARMICRLHGMPKSIVSDRDPIFVSKFWQKLFQLSGTKLRMSTAYHPQTDGQTEIVNKALQQYLRCFVHNTPKTWGNFLHWAEWHYNTSIHSSTGFTPFEVVYGKKPPSLPQYLTGTTDIEALDTMLTDRENILQILKNKLLKAQETMKRFADKSRIPHPFKEGDYVYVKLRPHRQVSVAGHRLRKLSKRYYGPFQIIKAMGPVAFELSLPQGSKIHPVFHVSQLKPCDSTSTPPLNLPPLAVDNQPIVQPLAILGWRHKEGTDQQQVLIQWEGMLPEDTTWEDLEDMRAIFPDLNLEDKVFVEEGRDVMEEPREEEDWAEDY